MKKIAIIGFGVTGKAILRYFIGQTKEKNVSDSSDSIYQISVFDSKTESDFEDVSEEIKKYRAEGVEFNFEKTDFVEDEFDLIMVSPGVPLTLPVLLRAKEKNIPIKNDITLFIENWRNIGFGKIVGVTGSNGKTTIVNLLYKYLQDSKIDSIMAGNIGNSPLDILINYKDEIGNENDMIAILELSSFQLEAFQSEHHLDVCLISNLSSNHLDRYGGSMQKYANAKMNGIDPQKTEVVLCADDEGIKKYVLPKIKNKKVSLVSFETALDQASQKGVYMDSENDLVLKNSDSVKKVFTHINDRKLLGIHNLYNIAMVYGILDFLNVNLDNDGTVRNFKGLEHRIEFVRELDSVKYINDSKSSSPTATKVAIESLTKEKNIILILGGNDKDMNFGVLVEPVSDFVEKIILLPGNIDKKIVKTLSEIVEIEKADNLVDAVRLAREIAPENGFVLLSPAATSFKLYKNYEERGEHFKNLVKGM